MKAHVAGEVIRPCVILCEEEAGVLGEPVHDDGVAGDRAAYPVIQGRFQRPELIFKRLDGSLREPIGLRLSRVRVFGNGKVGEFYLLRLGIGMKIDVRDIARFENIWKWNRVVG